MASRNRSRLKRAAILGLALFFAFQVLSWTEPLWLFGVVEKLAPGIAWRVHTTLPLVALTFDDGPNPVHTPQVLAILSRYGAHATFFVIGSRAQAHPGLVADLRLAGHEVGNHYFRDGLALGDSAPEFLKNLIATERAAGIDGPAKLFRPPMGLAWPSQLRLAHDRGYTSVLGSAYPHDPSHPPVRYIEWLVIKNLVPGAIVILHDGIPDPSRSLQALPNILEAARRKGLRVVTVGELLRSAEDRR